MNIFWRCAALLLIGIAVGAVNGWWEVQGTQLPTSRSDQAVSAEPLPAGAARARAVVVNGETHDFGVMEQNGSKSHVFLIRNDGNQPLRLEAGHTTCKCTLSEVGHEVVKPGETAEVALKWEAKTSDPEFSQSAEIKVFGDPEREMIRLVVFGKVRQALFSERQEVVFNQVTANDQVTIRYRVFAFLEDKFQVTSHELFNPATAPQFDVQVTQLSPDELKKEVGAKAGVEVAVTLKPGLPLGPIEQKLKLNHNLDSQPPLVFPFTGKIVSDIMLAGPKVNSDTNSIGLGALLRGEGTAAEIFLLVKGPHREETQIQLVGVEPASSLQAELGEPIRDNPKLVRYPLKLRVLPTADPGNYLGVNDGPTGQISFTTTHPHVPKFSVKVRFLVKDEVR